ncbi:MAG: peptidyl-prolyl cis-trans isomerase [Victivallales bacterium]|nr:peptidyl-prolyl cis-trans isomerase [Victivallales bacterium]
MADSGFDFSVPNTASSKPTHERSMVGFFVMILIVQVLTLCAVVLLPRGVDSKIGEGVAESDRLQEFAMKLESLGLAREAADAWRDYILKCSPETQKAANVWYRIGTILQAGRYYEEALAAYYRSDSLMKLPELELEITRRTQQCLEALGKAAAVRRNLEDRTSVGTPSDEPPMLEIGNLKVTRKELEALAEEEIDKMLAASGLDESQKLNYKKELMKQRVQGEGLTRFTQQFIAKELTYRAAVDEKLAEDAAVRDTLLNAERSVLSQEYIRRRLASINVSDAEIDDHYKAHPEEFTDKAAVRIAHIEFKDKESAEAALKSLAGKQDFSEMAKLLSQDSRTASKGGELEGWITADDREDWRKAVASEILSSPEKVEKGTVLPKAYGDKSWHVVKLLDRRDAKLRELKDVHNAIKARLTERKTGEIYDAVLKGLAEKYGVKWHNLADDKEPQSDGGER